MKAKEERGEENESPIQDEPMHKIIIQRLCEIEKRSFLQSIFDLIPRRPILSLFCIRKKNFFSSLIEK